MPNADVATFFQRHCAVDRAGDALYLPGWSVDDWARLLALAQPVSLGSGDVLIRRGESDRAVYFVASGALEVAVGTDRGDAMGRLFRERPGSVIGEISFFDGRPRAATVWAAKPTTLLRLDHDALLRFAAEHGAHGRDLLLALGRVLAFRLRRGEARRVPQPY